MTQVTHREKCPAWNTLIFIALRLMGAASEGRLIKRDEQIKLPVTEAAVILKGSKMRPFVVATKWGEMEQVFHAGRTSLVLSVR